MGYNVGTITNCYSLGSVEGKDYVGGLVGWNGGTITDCHSSTDVSGDTWVGGLVGTNAGGFGIITALNYKTNEEFQSELEKMNKLTKQPWGVNFSIMPPRFPFPPCTS